MLTDIYIEALSPRVRSDKYGRDMPVYVVYEDIMDILDKIKKRDGEKDREFLAKIFGPDIVKVSNSDFNEISMVLELGGISAMRVWNEMSFDMRARIRAQRIINGMVQVISKYYEEMDETRKKMASGNK